MPMCHNAAMNKLDEPFRDLTQGRTCVVCRTPRERSLFYDHPTGYNGLGSKCKICISSAPISPKKKELYDRRREARECVKCGTQPTVNEVFCERCWFTSAAATCAGGSKNAHLIIDLWHRQGGCCYYTGEPLVPGSNASLDHQQPRSRGGRDVPDNLRWVSLRVNLMKTSMTHGEFIKTCAQIASKFGYES